MNWNSHATQIHKRFTLAALCGMRSAELNAKLNTAITALGGQSGLFSTVFTITRTTARSLGES